MTIREKTVEERADRRGKRPKSDHVKLGNRGEDTACAYLLRRGMDILERNWRCPAGEVDIVAYSPGCLHFVEVKTRRGTGAGFPEEAVDERRRHKYECIAEYYLRGFETTDIRVQFDVVSIISTAEQRAFLRYQPGAFQME